MAGKSINGTESGSNGTETEFPIISGAIDEATHDDDGNSIPTVEPTIINCDPDANDGAPRKRGRPRGSKNASAKSTKQEAADLTNILVTMHYMLAKITTIEELELDDTEAKKLGDAIARVNSLYNGFMLSEKQMAWINLAAAAGTVYGPRIAAYNLRHKKEAKEKTVTMPSPKVM